MLEIAKVRSWDGNKRKGEIKASKHSGLSHDAGPLIGVNFDQKTSEKMASPYIERSDLIN